MAAGFIFYAEAKEVFEQPTLSPPLPSFKKWVFCLSKRHRLSSCSDKSATCIRVYSSSSSQKRNKEIREIEKYKRKRHENKEKKLIRAYRTSISFNKAK